MKLSKRPKPSEKELLGARIRSARVAASLSQQELADRAGTYKSCISDWEHGHREPSLAQLRAIAGVLEVDITDLVAEAA